ncbi:MAG: NADH-quinone oxidoreductase subunit NuoK [Acidobacteriota bacterium]|nr:MAG: NADH-quinone oxidoreductase subunit NuoK [Acidobacteriota bacterium]
MVSTTQFLVLGAILFSIGTLGVIVRRNTITMFMSIELMLNAVNLTFLAFARHFDQVDGQIFVFFVMTVAAAEAAVGLALIVLLSKRNDSVDIDQANTMKW